MPTLAPCYLSPSASGPWDSPYEWTLHALWRNNRLRTLHRNGTNIFAPISFHHLPPSTTSCGGHLHSRLGAHLMTLLIGGQRIDHLYDDLALGSTIVISDRPLYINLMELMLEPPFSVYTPRYPHWSGGGVTTDAFQPTARKRRKHIFMAPLRSNNTQCNLLDSIFVIGVIK